MPLKNKYLKYSPEITLEIFTLVWDKLIKSGLERNSNYTLISTYNEFNGSEYKYLLMWDEKRFYTYNYFNNLSETRVQEILGYNPFVKDDFVLPEKWCVKTNNQDDLYILNSFFNKLSNSNHFSGNFGYYHFPDVNGNKVNTRHTLHTFKIIKEGYIEITFDQFKKHVLKEFIKESKVMETKIESKEIIPEYMKCIIDTWSDNNSNLGKIFKVEVGKDDGRYIPGYCIEGSISWTRNLNPSTKEAFDAQNQLKQPLKQAVHCKTQEEWDFILSKFNP